MPLLFPAKCHPPGVVTSLPMALVSGGFGDNTEFAALERSNQPLGVSVSLPSLAAPLVLGSALGSGPKGGSRLMWGERGWNGGERGEDEDGRELEQGDWDVCGQPRARSPLGSWHSPRVPTCVRRGQGWERFPRVWKGRGCSSHLSLHPCKLGGHWEGTDGDTRRAQVGTLGGHRWGHGNIVGIVLLPPPCWKPPELLSPQPSGLPSPPCAPQKDTPGTPCPCPQHPRKDESTTRRRGHSLYFVDRSKSQSKSHFFFFLR